MERANRHICKVSGFQSQPAFYHLIARRIYFTYPCTIYSEDINQIKSSLSILLFDEVIEDVVTNEDATSGNSIYQKVFNRFLGELIIPFSTIYTSQRVSYLLFI